MSSRYLAVLLIGLVGPAVCTADGPRQEPAKPTQRVKKTDRANSLAEQIATIKKEHQEREKNFYDELRAAKHDNQKISQANREYSEFTRGQAAQLKGLIKGHGEDPAVFEGVLVLVGQLRYFMDDDLVQLVLQHHLANPDMGQLCFHLRYRSTERWAEKLLQEVAAKHPQQTARGQAVYALGDYYRYRAFPWGQNLPEAEKSKWLAEATRYYTEVTKTYAALPTPDGRAKLGDKAATELTRIKNLPKLKVGKTAPEIIGEDIDGKAFKLSDYRGKVVVLDFWGHW